MTRIEGRLLLNGELIPGVLHLAGERIARVEPLTVDAGKAAELPVVAPGFIDLHIHGFGGFDPLEDLAGMARALAAAGTTAFQPTLFPGEPRALGADAERASRAAAALDPGQGARVVGLHLEGPFLNPRAAGAIPVDALAAPTMQGLRAILGPASGDGRGVRTVTIAPELPGSADLIQELVRCGVRVSLGHSRATAAEARSAARAGAVGATHLFNAMSGVHHRDVGLAGAALLEQALHAEIIGDLVHVGADAFQLALAARGPEGLCLVSDALRGAGTGCDAFHSHGRDHIVRGGTAYYPPKEPGGEPQLAGCASSQLEMVRGLVQAGVASLPEALRMAAATPAAALGRAAELGVLAPGALADLVVLRGRGLELESVFVAGHLIKKSHAS